MSKGIKDYNVNTMAIEGRVYVKHKDKYVMENRVFRIKVEDDTLNLEVIDSHSSKDRDNKAGIHYLS